MGLQGTMSPFLGNLSFLGSLDLGNNSFHGPLIHEIGHLRRLKELILADNMIEGVIPPALCHCLELEMLDLSDNRFSGGIPGELVIMNKLNTIYLDNNFLTGTIPFFLGNITTLEELSFDNNNLAGPLPLTIFNISSILRIYLNFNSISGSLPVDMCKYWPKLEGLYISGNHFDGQISSSIAKCQQLIGLDISENRFYGSIPAEVGNLPELQILNIGRNNFTGQLFNFSSVKILSMALNNLSGHLPETTGSQLPQLEEFYMGLNQLSGNIPTYLSNSSGLKILSLDGNQFTGSIPTSLGNLLLLRILTVSANQLTREKENLKLNFLTSLSNCRYLEELALAGNPLNGMIPVSVGNLSGSLQLLDASSCQIKGRIPIQIGELKNLQLLDLGNNEIEGSISSTIGKLRSLIELHLENNKIEGPIPNELCLLSQLEKLSLQSNYISGPIPSCITNLVHLEELLLCFNKLNSSVPPSIWTLENLRLLNFRANNLSGNLPSPSAVSKTMEIMDLSSNHIVGNISGGFGSLESLGSIPESFGDLRGLESMDLSDNDLSGHIPKSLEKLRYLKYLNLSFNMLSGEIPNGGPFENLTAESFMGNHALCGKPVLQVPPCKIHDAGNTRTKQILLKYIVPAIASILISSGFVYMLMQCWYGKTPGPNVDESDRVAEQRIITHNEICRATNYFCDDNLIGSGSFGSVFKAVFSDGLIAAVKVLNLEQEGAFRSFDAECEVLKNVRHRNLVKVITTCSNLEFRALVMQYMPNGSLDRWLYSRNYSLDLLQRVSIMLDVALASEYLHHGQTTPVIHSDLKPSNILLDGDMVAHVCDFGIAKILAKDKNATQTKTLGTLGYIAPEYGSGGFVTTKTDIYSYGITLLETFARRKPTDEMFTEQSSMRQWVNALVPDRLIEAIDRNLLTGQDSTMNVGPGILLAMLELGLECSTESSEERVDIKDVVIKLNKIKLQLLRNN
ncbi:Non-specific serine/threonine protein kinase [Bertholletia excelsa]